MKKALITILQYVVFLGLGIWIIYHMLHELSPEQEQKLIASLHQVNLWYAFPIFIVGFLSHFFRAVRWRYLLETTGMHPTLANTTMAVLIGYITNLAIPRGGEVAKCTVLAKYEKMPAHKMIGTIVAERAFDVFCLLVVAVLALLLEFTTISDFVADMMKDFKQKIRDHQNILFISVAILAILIIAAVIMYRRHKETRFGRLMKELAHGVLSIFHMKKRWQFIFYTVLIWLTYLGQIYLGFLALPDTAHLGILTALVVLVYGSVGMIITPGGIGAYTWMVAQILTVYAIDDGPAQAFGWIAWAVQTVIIILLGIVSFILIHPYNRKRDAQAAVDTEQNIQP
jgi:uncharacterized protein (TIRG00374 family)